MQIETLDASRASIKHNLELSIISNAPFATGFLEILYNFIKCHNAPFREYFLDMIKFKLIKDKVSRCIFLNS